MKSLILILLSCFFALCLLGFVFVHHMETEKQLQLYKRENDFLLRRNEKLEQDNKDFRKCLDSLKIQIR